MNADNATQVKLLCALVGDPDFFRENIANLHRGDFPYLAAKLVFETVRAHWRLYGALPTAKTLPDEVLDAMRGIGPDGKESILTSIPKTLLHSVASCLGKVVEAINHPDPSNTAYFRDRWKDYLSSVRIERLNAAGMSAKEQLEEAAKLNEEIERISGGRKSASTSARKRVVSTRDSRKVRFGTGVWPIDIRMKMGMELGELGCILAGTGTGKTNMLINFAVNAAMSGKRVLFLSLEVSEEVILKRLQAMFGTFRMSLMDKPEEEWTPKELERYNYMLSDAFPYIDYIEVNTEFTSRSATCSDIDREIKAWKKRMYEQGLSDNDCPLVCIDYIHQMDPAGVANAKDNENTKYGNIAMHLRQMAVANRCVIWTAQQTKRESEKKSHLANSDCADAIDIPRRCDVVLGMTLAGVDARTGQEIDPYGVQDGAKVTNESEDDTADNHGDKERLINVDFCKLRNSGEKSTFCTVFQSKSLRLWTSASYADRAEANVERMSFGDFFAATRPKTVD